MMEVLSGYIDNFIICNIYIFFNEMHINYGSKQYYGLLYITLPII